MREKDKEDVTAHEYLITPPGQKKRIEETQKKDTGVDSNLHWARLHTRKKQNTHALVEKQREMFLLLALPFT